MDVASWQQRWQQGRIGFHLADVNPLLIKYCHRLGLQPGDKVLVPLCGKSRDMHWLHGQDYAVTGVELSPIAAEAFFKENNLHACDLVDGRFTIWRHAELEIHCGDIFEFSNEGSDDIAACYDRAALIALPETGRSAYVQHLTHLLPAGSQTLLITLEYKQDEMRRMKCRGRLSLYHSQKYRGCMKRLLMWSCWKPWMHSSHLRTCGSEVRPS